MGNSNSIGQFNPNEIDLRQRAHWQYLSQQQQQQHHGRDSGTTSIKVLPELKDNNGGHLRPTDNGVILFNGGTISGRRDSVGVVRSKSISSPHQEYMRGLQRHKTQLDMPVSRSAQQQQNQNHHHQQQQQQSSGQHHRLGMGMGLRRDVDPKLFGSEPDLRLSPPDNATALTTTTLAGRNSKKFKGHPAQPPSATSQQQQQRDYDSTRFGWRPKPPGSHGKYQQQQQQSSSSNNINTHNNINHHQHQSQQPHSQSRHQQQQQQQQHETPKKPRLFKTREETKKVSSKANQSKLATEASDVQSKKPINGRTPSNRDQERVRGE